MEVVIPCGFLMLWVVSFAFIRNIAKQKEHPATLGITLGCLLGPLGWIILKSLPPYPAKITKITYIITGWVIIIFGVIAILGSFFLISSSSTYREQGLDQPAIDRLAGIFLGFMLMGGIVIYAGNTLVSKGLERRSFAELLEMKKHKRVIYRPETVETKLLGASGELVVYGLLGDAKEILKTIYNLLRSFFLHLKHKLIEKHWGDRVDHQRRSYVYELLRAGIELPPQSRKQIAKRFGCSPDTIYMDVMYFKAANDNKALRYVMRRKFTAQKARAKKYLSKDTITFEQFMSLVEESGDRCNSCGRVVGRQYLVPNHVKPLQDGGDNTLDNIIVICNRCREKAYRKKSKKGIVAIKMFGANLKRIKKYRSGQKS